MPTIEGTPAVNRSHIGRTTRSTILAAAIAFSWLAFGATASALADTHTWNNGDYDGTWTNPANWDNYAVPDTGDDVVIPATDTTGAVLISDVPTISLNSLSIQDAGVDGVTQQLASAINSTITLTAASTWTGGRFVGLTVDADAGLTIGLNSEGHGIVLDESTLNVGAGGMTADGSIALDDATVRIDGSVSGTALDITGPGNYRQLQGTVSIPLLTGDQVTTTLSDEGNTVSYTGVTTNFNGDVHVIDGTADLTATDSQFNGDTTLIGGTTLLTDATIDGPLEVQGGTTQFSNVAIGNSLLVEEAVSLGSPGALVLGPESESLIKGSLMGPLITNNGEMTLNAGGAVSGNGMTSAFTNNGDLYMGANSGVSQFGMMVSSFTNNGLVSMGENAQVTAAAMGPAGSFSNGEGAQLVLAASSASISVSGTFFNQGELDLQDGVLSATGAFQQTASGTTSVRLSGSGSAAGTDYTQLSVSGAATLAGTLVAKRMGSFDAAPGTTMPVVTYASRTGSFDTVSTVDSNDFDPNKGTYLVTDDATDATEFRLVQKRVTLAVAGGVVRAGDAFSVSGTGFIAGEQVRLQLGVSTGNSGGPVGEPVMVTANGSGAIAGSVPVPDGAASSSATAMYSVIATGLTSDAFKRADATVTAPVQIETDTDTDGDGIDDDDDCAPEDKTKPAQGSGVTDANCNGVNDAGETNRVKGSNGADKLVGSTGKDRINGGRGSDRIFGRGGNDTLLGALGFDTLLGGTGDDLLNGGPGNDLLVGGPGMDRLFGVMGNDRLVGNGGADLLSGGVGDDRLVGGFGKDRLIGGAGDDVLNGADTHGGDTLACGKGDDVAIADGDDVVARTCEKVIRR